MPAGPRHVAGPAGIGPEVRIGFPSERGDEIAALLRAYEQSLGVPLDFQGFAAEVAGLPGDYAAPHGSFAWAQDGDRIVAVVAVRALDRTAGIAELKRLYVDPRARGNRLGRRLTEAMLREARRLGYSRLRLDTLPSMREALQLYRSMGFREIPAYNTNPVVGALFLELSLGGDEP